MTALLSDADLVTGAARLTARLDDFAKFTDEPGGHCTTEAKAPLAHRECRKAAHVLSAGYLL
jgi:hypothetical protein